MKKLFLLLSVAVVLVSCEKEIIEKDYDNNLKSETTAFEVQDWKIDKMITARGYEYPGKSSAFDEITFETDSTGFTVDYIDGKDVSIVSKVTYKFENGLFIYSSKSTTMPIDTFNVVKHTDTELVIYESGISQVDTLYFIK